MINVVKIGVQYALKISCDNILYCIKYRRTIMTQRNFGNSIFLTAYSALGETVLSRDGVTLLYSGR